jgi:hypothetical protein
MLFSPEKTLQLCTPYLYLLDMHHVAHLVSGNEQRDDVLLKVMGTSINR